MKRRDERRRLPRHQRKREVVEMKMHEIEFVGPPIYLFDHHHMERIGVAHGAVEPQRARPNRLQLGGGNQVSTCK